MASSWNFTFHSAAELHRTPPRSFFPFAKFYSYSLRNLEMLGKNGIVPQILLERCSLRLGVAAVGWKK
jgi:hypothetical protein